MDKYSSIQTVTKGNPAAMCATQQAEIPQALLTLKNAIEDAGRAADGLRDKLQLVTNPSERPGHPECIKQPSPTKSPLATELDSMTDSVRRLVSILNEQTERTELS